MNWSGERWEQEGAEVWEECRVRQEWQLLQWTACFGNGSWKSMFCHLLWCASLPWAKAHAFLRASDEPFADESISSPWGFHPLMWYPYYHNFAQMVWINLVTLQFSVTKFSTHSYGCWCTNNVELVGSRNSHGTVSVLHYSEAICCLYATEFVGLIASSYSNHWDQGCMVQTS